MADLRKQTDVDKPTCGVEDCCEPVHAHLYCSKHYQRWKKYGDPGIVHRRPVPPEKCLADGCEGRPVTRGWCMKHYTCWRRYGDPLGGRTQPPNEAVTYSSLHRRLRKARGSARAHQCVRCGKRAVNWAHLHGEDPHDFANYVPMCKSCHSRYDTYVETRAKWQQGMAEYWTPERRAEWSERLRRRARTQQEGVVDR